MRPCFFFGIKGNPALITKEKPVSQSSSSQPDLYRRITDHIIQAIEAGADAWQMPWHTDGQNLMRPINAANGKPYRGVNVLALWVAAQEQGYDSDRWATYKQWQELGAQVRKGERSSQIVFWKFNDNAAGEGSEESGQADDDSGRRPIIARGYAVFNAAQVDGDPAPLAAPVAVNPESQRIEQAEQFFAATGADIRHGGRRAFYRPSSDHIQMPPFEVFRDAIAYYSVLSHESTHWTGAKPRLDRDLTGRFGTHAYAAEELIAELGAAFLCAQLGLANEPRPDHAAYVSQWLKVLKEDSRAIFTASSKAQQAADYLQSLQPQPAAELAAAPPKRSTAPRFTP